MQNFPPDTDETSEKSRESSEKSRESSEKSREKSREISREISSESSRKQETLTSSFNSNSAIVFQPSSTPPDSLEDKIVISDIDQPSIPWLQPVERSWIKCGLIGVYFGP